MRVCFVLLFGLMAGDAMGQTIDQPSLTERAEFEICLTGGDEEACHGVVSEACFDAQERDGQERALACAQRELILWEELVDERFSRLLEAVQMAEAPQPDDDGGNSGDELRALQSFWESLRDSDCAQMASAYRVETLSRLTALECLRLRTADRAIWLGSQLPPLPEEAEAEPRE